MRWIFPLTVLLLLTLPVHAGHSPPKVVLRVHVQTTGAGQSPLAATTITIPPNGEQIQVRTMPEMTEGELVGVSQDAGGTVHLQFNHEGQVSLSAVTAQNEGRILVVLIDGYVIYAPLIDEQITTGELDIPPPHVVPALVLQLLQDVARENIRRAAKT
jgi:hypothetical protein